MIRTVTGMISREALGHCQCHEHIWIEGGPPAQQVLNQKLDEEEKSLEELKDYYQAGGRTIVDCQPIGCGQNPPLLKKLSLESQVQIICVSGFHKMEYYSPQDPICTGPFSPVEEKWKQELQEWSGLLKGALDREGMESPGYLARWKALARVQRETGASLVVHTDGPGTVLPLLSFLEQEQVDPGKVAFCHMDRTEPDRKVHRKVLEEGAYLEYDTICREKYHTQEKENEQIEEVLSWGGGERLLLSLDTTRARLFSYGGQVGLSCLLHPEVLSLTPEWYHQIFHVNPGKFLEGKE